MSESDRPPWSRGDRTALWALLFTMVVTLGGSFAGFLEAKWRGERTERDVQDIKTAIESINAHLQAAAKEEAEDRKQTALKLESQAGDVKALRERLPERRR